MQGIFSTLVASSFCWFVASSLWVYPHSLSYFNESIGGPLNGPKHLLGSNVDWGQDLRYLKWEMEAYQSRTRWHLAYFGGAIRGLGFADTLAWPEKSGKSTKHFWKDDKEPVTSFQKHAISACLLIGQCCAAKDGAHKVSYDIAVPEVVAQRAAEFVDHVGYSLYIVDLKQAISQGTNGTALP